MFWIYDSPYSTSVRYCYFSYRKDKRIKGGIYYSKILEKLVIGTRLYKESGPHSKDFKI